MTDGIINVYKERGFTSHDVVAKLRGILRERRIGHTGTLDPEAEGVLPVCVGRATKVCSLLTDGRKTYRAVLRLGVRTTTQDMTGEIVSERPVGSSVEEILDCIASFQGEIWQIPPMYSARKINGKKLYELARSGVEVEREPSKVTIYEIAVEAVSLPCVTLRVTCSKGTYIRTLCEDIGQKLGCGGCMEALTRTAVGPFLIGDSMRLGQIEELRDGGRLADAFLPIDAVFSELRELRLLPEGERFVRNGNPFRLQDAEVVPAGAHRNAEAVSGAQLDRKVASETQQGVKVFSEASGEPAAARTLQDGERVRVYSTKGEFLAVYEWRADRGLCWPVKMFL